MKTNNVVKLKRLSNKETNKARASLVEGSKDVIDDSSFPIQGYALVAWTNGGNHTITKYYSRLDYPIICMPEMVKQTLLRVVNNN